MSTSFALSLWDADTVAWVFGSVAIALTLGRYLIRWKITCKFHADDIAHLFAVIFMIVELACYHAGITEILDFEAFARGQGTEDDAEYNMIEALSSVNHIFFFCSLWCVKLAFLLFYRTLFNISKAFNTAWWIVLGFNFVTFCMAIVGALLVCAGQPSHLTDWKLCESPAAVPILRQSYIFVYVAVVTSDLAVMILPSVMLRNLRMRLAQKCAIGAIFCLSFVSIAFETLRLAKSFIGGGELNVLWIELESAIAVIVSALPTYYSLVHWRNERLTRASNSEAALRYGTSSKVWSRYRTRRGDSQVPSTHSIDSRKDLNKETITQTYEIHMDVIKSDRPSANVV